MTEIGRVPTPYRYVMRLVLAGKCGKDKDPGGMYVGMHIEFLGGCGPYCLSSVA